MTAATDDRKWGLNVRARMGYSMIWRVGRAVAGRPDWVASRKVRTPEGRTLAKCQEGRPYGKWHRKDTAGGFGSIGTDGSCSRGAVLWCAMAGKGEKVR